MSTVRLKVVACLALAGCTAEQSDGQGGGFCEAAAAAPGCDPVDACEDHFTQGRVEHPACGELYDEFGSCLSQLEISCVNGADFEIHATGDGSPYDRFIYVMPYYLFYVRDTACREIGTELQACTMCADAPGYPDGPGIGDRCGGAGGCASGLTCELGMCTQPCSSLDDCLGTNAAPFADTRTCQNEFGLDNQCIDGKCTSNSDVANDFCAAYGAGWEPAGGGLYCAHP